MERVGCGNEDLRAKNHWLEFLSNIIGSKLIMAEITLKRDGYALEMKTFKSSDGKNSYLIFKESDGKYHSFVEVEAKDAAIHCGSQLSRDETTRQHWDSLW